MSPLPSANDPPLSGRDYSPELFSPPTPSFLIYLHSLLFYPYVP